MVVWSTRVPALGIIIYRNEIRAIPSTVKVYVIIHIDNLALLSTASSSKQVYRSVVTL